MNKYSREEVRKETLKYFKGDSLATDVWINKYSLKDSEGNIYELSPNDMHHRLASELHRIENNYPNPLSEDQIFDLIKDFKYIIPQGGPMSGIGNNLQTISLSNCFVIGNTSDSYGGILQTDQEQVQLMKRRGGVGHDLSHIRPKGSPVKNSALTSTGVVPFMERFSNSTREVAQDGRRGALMLSISVIHPDSEDFIDAKMTEGKVTGANVSVKLTDEFMKCVLENKPFTQQFPIDSPNPTYTKQIDARKLWNKIIHNAWKSAEPGLLFWDTIIRESIPDCYEEYGFKTVSTNPCLVSDTLVAVADGRNFITIKQLAEEGRDVPVYCLDNDGKLSIRIMRNPRITGYNQQIYKVTLENNHSIRVTGNHKFRLKNGSYIETKDLKYGDSLHILTKYENDLNVNVLNNGDLNDNLLENELLNNSKIDYIISSTDLINIDPTLVDSYIKSIENGYNTKIENGIVLIEKICEECHKPFWIDYQRREVSFCSQECALNHTNNDINIKNKRTESVNNTYSINGNLIKQKQLKIFKDLEFNLKRTPKLSEWEESCKENKIPFRLKTKHGFQSFNEIKEESEFYNHKVISVELDGFENVYNGTVDEFHNFFSGGFQESTKSGKIKYLSINQLNCGEIPLNCGDSCRLTALNLYSYVNNPFTKDANFDFELFSKHIVYAQKFMDDIVDLEIEKIDQILSKIEKDPESEDIKRVEKNIWLKIREKGLQGRRTGLGITSEGDMLAALGLTYGTDEATEFSIKVHQTLAMNAYKSSIIMAKERGSFQVWNYDSEKNNPFVKRIQSVLPKEYIQMWKETGRRNIALLTIAPTGSISILTQTTSGIEPVFQPIYMRRRKINPNDKNAKVSFVDENGDSWEEYNVFHPKFKVWCELNGYNVDELEKKKLSDIQDIVKLSPYYKATSNDVNWVNKVKMQGGVQRWIDHSISVTVNLPNDVNEELVSKVYETGWKSGCKGLTIYRDGSRAGVLVTKKDKKTDVFTENNAPKRPKSLVCDVMRFTNKGEKWIGFLGLYDNKPYEVFTGLQDDVNVPNYVVSAEIVKERNVETDGSSRYDVKWIDKDGYVQEFRGLSRAFNREYWNYSRLVSGLLRHGMPLPNVMSLIDRLDLGESETISSWKNGVKRMIKKYIKDGTVIKGQECPNCHSHNLIYKEGCMTCSDCGWSKCS